MDNNFIVFKNNKSKLYYIFFINYNLKIRISYNLYKMLLNYSGSNKLIQDKINNILYFYPYFPKFLLC